MSEHHAEIRWTRGTPGFAYDSYDRTHQIRFGGGAEILASAASEYLGRAELINPEEQFVAALSSCHMLTFLALAAKRRWVVDSYEDTAVGTLEKGTTGEFWVSRVVLRPRVVFSEKAAPTAEGLEELHHSAHRHCFIANSVKTDVQVEPR